MLRSYMRIWFDFQFEVLDFGRLHPYSTQYSSNVNLPTGKKLLYFKSGYLGLMFFVKNRSIQYPFGLAAKNRKDQCSSCPPLLISNLSTNHEANYHSSIYKKEWRQIQSLNLHGSLSLPSYQK